MMQILLFVLLSQMPAVKPEPQIVLRVDEDTNGPFGGERSKRCLRVYNNGTIYMGSHSLAGFIEKDQHGNETRPERKQFRQFKIESYEVSYLADLSESKEFRSLRDFYRPPHSAIDYFSTIRVRLEIGKFTKQITTREYYVASMAEKARYPSALVVLMEWIERTETEALQKGTELDKLPASAGCDLSFDSDRQPTPSR
jgi:hypothetical protein